MKKKSNFAAKDILEVFGLALIFLGIISATILFRVPQCNLILNLMIE